MQIVWTPGVHGSVGVWIADSFWSQPCSHWNSQEVSVDFTMIQTPKIQQMQLLTLMIPKPAGTRLLNHQGVSPLELPYPEQGPALTALLGVRQAPPTPGIAGEPILMASGLIWVQPMTGTKAKS